MTDYTSLPEPAETREVPPRPNQLLSWVCVLWLLNALTGAAVAIRENLPGELIGGVFTGRTLQRNSSKVRAQLCPPDSPT
jgi:hypothetical protein